MSQIRFVRITGKMLLRAGLPTLAGAVVLSACGTGPASVSLGKPANAASGPAASTAPCSASDLRISLDTKAAGVAAGTSFVPLNFTNVNSTACLLSGFPVISFAVSRTGGDVGQPGAADRTAAAMSLSLAPGDSAHVWLRVASAQNLPPAQCEPETAAGFWVSLPGWPAGAFVPGQALTCAKGIRGSELLIIEPFSPGLARRGTA